MRLKYCSNWHLISPHLLLHSRTIRPLARGSIRERSDRRRSILSKGNSRIGVDRYIGSNRGGQGWFPPSNIFNTNTKLTHCMRDPEVKQTRHLPTLLNASMMAPLCCHFPVRFYVMLANARNAVTSLGAIRLYQKHVYTRLTEPSTTLPLNQLQASKTIDQYTTSVTVMQ